MRNHFYVVVTVRTRRGLHHYERHGIGSLEACNTFIAEKLYHWRRSRDTYAYHVEVKRIGPDGTTDTVRVVDEHKYGMEPIGDVSFV